MDRRPTITEQVAELKRERSMRERVYPYWISAGKIRKATADRQMAALVAAIETLERVNKEVPEYLFPGEGR